VTNAFENMHLIGAIEIYILIYDLIERRPPANQIICRLNHNKPACDLTRLNSDLISFIPILMISMESTFNKSLNSHSLMHLIVKTLHIENNMS